MTFESDTQLSSVNQNQHRLQGPKTPDSRTTAATRRRTPLCVVGVWFNIVLKNKLTKITFKMQQKTKEKKKRKDPDYKHSLPAGGGIAVLMED